MNRFADIDCSSKRLPPVYGFRSTKLVSIAKALQPIEPQISELNYYMKIAKKHCHFPNEHGLSKDQAAAVYIYTMEWGETTLYRVLNQALRADDRESLKIWFPYLKLFDTALDLLPIVKESVWRGIPLDIGDNFTKDQMLTWWAISSCSSSVGVIENFLKNETNSTLFLIEAVNGKKLSGYSQFDGEDEIILRIGSEFRVKANPLKRADGSHIVHLIEIDDNDDDDDDDDDEEEEDDENEDNSKPIVPAVKNLDATPKPPIQTNVPAVPIKSNLKWEQKATTVASKKESNQLQRPYSICFDDQQQSLYIVDTYHHCMSKWKLGENYGEVIAGTHTYGTSIEQLKEPTNAIVDRTTKSLIICDHGNRRVIRSSLVDQEDKEILISNIDCWGLAMNENGELFVSDEKQNEVKRWKKNEKEGTVVAGGNGKGNKLNQLDSPRMIFVDREDTVYVSEYENHRVTKWVKGAKEGIVVAGGHGQGSSLKQLHRPFGVVVNEMGDVYVTDCYNNRIMCWPSGSDEGHVVVGGRGGGKEPYQLNYPIGLLFDRENNLYVVDAWNDRIQRFKIEKN